MSEKKVGIERGKCDPGWNDPPNIDYEPTTGGKCKLNLNKRVAFPLQQGSYNNSSKPTAIVQPSLSGAVTPSTSQPPVARVHPMPPHSSTDTNQSSAQQIDSASVNAEEDMRIYCIGVLETYLASLNDESAIRRQELERRLNILSQMWANNALNSAIHKQLFIIAKGVESKDYTKAIESHRTLVLNHTNTCASWAVGLRQLILTLLPETTASSNEATAMSPSTSNPDDTRTVPMRTVLINPFNNFLVPAIPAIVPTSPGSDNNLASDLGTSNN